MRSGGNDGYRGLLCHKVATTGPGSKVSPGGVGEGGRESRGGNNRSGVTVLQSGCN